MTGLGRAAGAGTIVNAFATGRGAAFGVAYAVRARVRPAPRFRVLSNGRPLSAAEARLAVESVKAAHRALDQGGALEIQIRSDIPPRRGLKSSSAVSVAVVRATADEAGRRLSHARVLDAAAEAGLRSRTSLTGAYDDAAACLLGGVVLTDNHRRKILGTDRLPKDLVALVHTPTRTIATGGLRRAAFRGIADLIRGAWKLAAQGRYREAMLINTAAYAPLLRVDPQFTFAALAGGAHAAGLSGKGPAEIALVHRETLPRMRRILHAWPIRIVPLNASEVP